MNLAWTRQAVADRREIRTYIAQENPAAAIELDELLSARANFLLQHPGMGRPGRVTGTHELVAHRNYILIYDVTSNTVRILRVLHAARRWPSQKPD